VGVYEARIEEIERQIDKYDETDNGGISMHIVGTIFKVYRNNKL
jgi:predicted component of type VI protein secretion system